MAENDAPERIWIGGEQHQLRSANLRGGGNYYHERASYRSHTDIPYVRERADLPAPDAAPTCEYGSCRREKLCFHYCGEHHRSICGVPAPAGDVWSDLELIVECIDIPLPQKDSIVAAIRRTQARLADAVRQARREMWNSDALRDWDIVGMNHYHVDGERRLFVAMTNGIRCIRAEGADELEVFRVLELNAAALRAEGEKGDGND